RRAVAQGQRRASPGLGGGAGRGRLMRACVSCGASAADEARFCGQCAAPLDKATNASPRQERRQVTVFFSDLSGFTAMNERLDPEDVRDVVNNIWDRAGDIVGRYDGRINKLLGDAVMAVFGDPVAHEDDPSRAVRAALELHAAVEGLNQDFEPRIGAPIGIHTGVSTGVVLTSETILDGKQTGPLGDAINLASRLQSLAKTGQVLVGPETRRAIEGRFDLEDLGLHDLKGKGEPVAVARVRSIVSRSVTPARRQGRFVGRDTELSLLRDELERARKGTPAFVAVVENSSEILPPLLQLYDIEGSEGSSIDREAYRGRLLQSVRAILQTLADRGTLIVCLQDLHWADPSTVDLLRQLAGQLSASTLMLFNYRPEFSFHESGFREIKLEELSDRVTRELVASLLDSPEVPNEPVEFLETR